MSSNPLTLLYQRRHYGRLPPTSESTNQTQTVTLRSTIPVSRYAPRPYSLLYDHNYQDIRPRPGARSCSRQRGVRPRPPPSKPNTVTTAECSSSFRDISRIRQGPSQNKSEHRPRTRFKYSLVDLCASDWDAPPPAPFDEDKSTSHVHDDQQLRAREGSHRSQLILHEDPQSSQPSFRQEFQDQRQRGTSVKPPGPELSPQLMSKIPQAIPETSQSTCQEDFQDQREPKANAQSFHLPQTAESTPIPYLSSVNNSEDQFQPRHIRGIKRPRTPYPSPTRRRQRRFTRSQTLHNSPVGGRRRNAKGASARRVSRKATSIGRGGLFCGKLEVVREWVRVLTEARRWILERGVG